MQVMHGAIIRPKTSVTVTIESNEKVEEIRDWIENNITYEHCWSRSMVDAWDDQQIYDFRYEKDAAFFALRWT